MKNKCKISIQRQTGGLLIDFLCICPKVPFLPFVVIMLLIFRSGFIDLAVQRPVSGTLTEKLM